MAARRISPLARIPEEPAAAMPRPASRARRDRGWEREHRAIAFRIPAELNEAINAAVQEYKGNGWVTSCSRVAAAWLDAGRAAWEQGLVEVDGRPAGETGRRGR